MSGPPAADDDRQPTSLKAWRVLVRGFEGRGLMLRAYDAAARGLQEHPDDLWLKHRAVLDLARSGATETAMRRYEEYRLAEQDDEEIASLGARLAKDLAWLAAGKERAARGAAAAEAYGRVYARTGGYFPGINTATLRLIAGDRDGAGELARRILGDLDTLPAAPGEEAYYRGATAAEARLILGDVDGARDMLRQAVAAHGTDLGARATTRKQLRRVCEALGLDTGLLDELAAPRVLHYCGHMILPPGRAGRFPAAAEAEVAGRIAAHLDRRAVGFGYGALACGADILVAEALIERGAELNLVFPFRIDEFLDTSVRNGGPGWERRFERCLDRAATVHFATEDSYLGDDELFAYSSRLAIGLALLHARYLDAEVEQLAVWDGVAAEGPAGTAADVRLWRGSDHPQTIIPCPSSEPGKPAPTPDAPPPPPAPATATGRVNRAMLFGDVKGFSRLNDRQLPIFVRQVLGCMARVLEDYADSLRFRNTWGDGVYLVFDDLKQAARCALDLQAAMARLPLSELGLPEHIALRLGGHFGPVYEDTDPILRTTNYFGAHVSRAARVEPITPEGSVYVTEHFAADLALDPVGEFNCDYVGTIPAAKGYGDLGMYLLRARAPTRS